MDAVTLSFAKDALFGALAITTFSSIGWPQWKLAAVHIVSVPGVLFLDEGSRPLFVTLASLACMVVFVTDVIIVLTLTCEFSQCCTPGFKSPAFAPTIDVCTASSKKVESQLVAATAVFAVGIGSALSIARLSGLSGLRSVSWPALAFASCVMHVYQISWLTQQFYAYPFIAWAALAAAHAVRVVLRWSSVGWLIFIAELVGISAVASLPKELYIAFYTVQGLCVCIAAWASLPPRQPTAEAGAFGKKMSSMSL